MRLLDRYETRQLVPVWLWCLVVFVSMSVFIDLFEHLDEILRYAIPVRTVLQYYLCFVPLVVVRACPLALLLSSSFVATRLVRHQELLAMSAGGVSRQRASVPFLFVGWLAMVLAFLVNDQLVPGSAAMYEQLRRDAFHGQTSGRTLENVATMDTANRLYHARQFNPDTQELSELTILEHDQTNRPRKSIYARQARLVPEGIVLINGTVTHMDPEGRIEGNPEPFAERLFTLPVTKESFQQEAGELETMSFGQLRTLLGRLQTIGITNVRRHQVELASKISLPLMNLVLCLIGFTGATAPRSRGRLQELGTSLAWGMGYYIGVALGQGMAKEGLVPVVVGVWMPHLIAVGYCWWGLSRKN